MRRKAFLILSVSDFVLYLSMKSIWSGIRGMTGVAWLALFLFFLFAGIAIAQTVLFLLKKKTIATDILGGLSAALTVVLLYMFYLGIGSLKFFVRAFGDILATGIVLAAAALFVFRYPRSVCAAKAWYRRSLFGFLSAVVLILSFHLAYPFVTVNPTVYAVGTDYQIVWSTSAPATGTVKVGRVTYFDEYAGSLRSGETVHKVTVPMAALDEEMSYEIASVHYLYRGPYSGIEGAHVHKTFAFVPVDVGDGLDYYTLSDVHEYRRAAAKAAAWFGSDLDFLVLAGDISSTYESVEDLEFIGKLAYDVTKGEKPVVFARGNHDVKGAAADRLDRYVGATEEGDFYYTFSFDKVAGVVLDLGEDHADTWWEFYGTADYDSYRDRQTAFLEDLLASGSFEDPDKEYRLAVCHMPIAYVEENGFLTDVKVAWTELLDLLGIDVVVSGHIHELLVFGPAMDAEPYVPLYFDPGYREREASAGFRTDMAFVNFVCCRRSLVQDFGVQESVFGGAFTGLATTVDFLAGTSVSRYTNSRGEVVSIVDAFSGTTATEFVVPLS